MLIDRRSIAHFDWGLFALAMLIPSFGLVVLYSAGYDPDGSRVVWRWLPLTTYSPAAVKQAFFLLFGLVVMLAGMSLPLQFLNRYAYLIYGAGIVGLVAVLVAGDVSHGARRWFAVSGIKVQPAEAMKIGLILAMARFLSKNPPPAGGYRLKQCVLPFLIFLCPMGLIVKQPDLGTALVIGAVGFMMLIFAGVRPRSLLIMAVVVALVVGFGWDMLHPYQQRRVEVLFNPEADPLGSGYHITQSKIAVGSGQLLGKGFLRGTQNQLQFLPEHTTDFVFSVLAEEWGFVGAIFVLTIYLYFLYRLLRVVARSTSLFGAFVAFGVAAQVFFHTFVNVGMVIGLLPVVGLPLPLFSYGGSSVLSTMFIVGIVLGISMRRLSFSGN